MAHIVQEEYRLHSSGKNTGPNWANISNLVQ